MTEYQYGIIMLLICIVGEQTANNIWKRWLWRFMVGFVLLVVILMRLLN